MIDSSIAASALADLWQGAGLDAGVLPRARLTGADPVLPSSFAVGAAAQSAIGAAALAATELGRARGDRARTVSVDMAAALAECSAWFSIEGRVPDRWDKVSGLYRCRDGWVRVHANFAHHRDGALRLLGLAPGADTPRAAVEMALASRGALEFEAAAAEAGLVVAAVRDFDAWDATPQAAAIASQPLITWERTGDAPPVSWPEWRPGSKPLAGIRVLDLTRILAGPVGGRTLAAYGAEVMLVNSPGLPNIESIIETSRGKLSCHIDLDTEAGRESLRELVAGAHVFVQGYRPGALAARGFGPEALARLNPGLVQVSLSAYGHLGPWGTRRGYDSLVQTATGFNDAEMRAAGEDKPRALPVQILDYASGFLVAFAAQVGLLRQAREGGGWHARVALARTALWLRSLPRVEGGFAVGVPPIDRFVETSPSGWGTLAAVRHAGLIEGLAPGWTRPSVRPGTHPPRWV
jgi:crotonobetainyl-CoA:carnitine CoA-transferase CaiB-like acyl-CoA transferase